jgi:hypothetical protein
MEVIGRTNVSDGSASNDIMNGPGWEYYKRDYISARATFTRTILIVAFGLVPG